METVKRFINDKTTVQDVQEAIIKILEEEIVESAYSGKDVAPIAQAKHVIAKSFLKLKQEYGIPEKEDMVDHSE